FADKWQPEYAARAYPDPPELGDLSGYWFFGFDTAHAYDLVPGLTIPSMLGLHNTYRNFEWVKAEVNSLADQLYAIEGANYVT
ncbi:MAG TPA: hypothetical protein VIY48_14775, partial [Candidatus Paceibacterota bacterium]